MTRNDNHDKLDTVAASVQMMLDGAGITLSDLAARLANAPAGPPTATLSEPPVAGQNGGGTVRPGRADVAEAAAGDPNRTLRAAVEMAELALPPGTVKTYRTYWRVANDGIRLPRSWDRARIDRYAADLARLDKEHKLNLQLPTHIHACPRDDEDRLIVRRGHGDAQLDAVGHSDIQILAKWVTAHALAKAAERDRVRAAAGRPPTRSTGHGAQENFVAAMRSLYTTAAADRLVEAGYSPAAGVKKERRSGAKTRRAHTNLELRDVWLTHSTTGNDPELDALIFRLEMETATRQEGCINLILSYLDHDRQTTWLKQKNDKLQEFPITAGLLRDLAAFATSRGASDPNDYVLRQRVRTRHSSDAHPPITSRRFDKIHERVRDQHRWAMQCEWSSYWIRHHAAAQIEAIGGRPCKMRLLDHEPNGQTDMYGKATIEHLAWALSIATGEPHPLAQKPPWIVG